MALEPGRLLAPATTGSDCANGASASAPAVDADGLPEDDVRQVQSGDRVKANRRRLTVENATFLEMAEMLPVRGPVRGSVDKLNVLRLAIAFIKVARLYRRDFQQTPRSHVREQWETSETLTDALSGFVFILDGNGWILYISDSVSKHLGHSAADMMGSNIRGYLHSEDMAALASLLKLPVRAVTSQGEPCQLLLRVTTSLRRWRPSSSASCSRYSVVLCSGYRRLCQLTESPISEHNRSNNILLLATGYTLPHSYLPQCEFETESGMLVRSSLTVLGQRSFMFRSGLCLTPFYVEAAVKELTEYETFTFSRHSLYHFVHPCDIESVSRSHKDVLAKGHSITGYYRLIVRSGGWIWMQSYFSIVHAARTTRKKFILAVNYAITNVENSSSESNNVGCPSQVLSARNGPGTSDRNKGKELSRSEQITHLESTPADVRCYANPDQHASLGTSGSQQNNAHNAAMAYSCALSNLMKALAEKERRWNQETHMGLLQSQREVDEIRSNASAGRLSINTAGLSGGTVHHKLLGSSQKRVRRDRRRKFTRQLGRIPGPGDWRLHHLEHQPLKSTLKFISEATPFTDDDESNGTNGLMFDTGLIGGGNQFLDRRHIQVNSLTPAQNYNAEIDTYQPLLWENSFPAPTLPKRNDVNLRPEEKTSCRNHNARMGRISEHALPNGHGTLQQSLFPTQALHSETKYTLQVEDCASGSTTESTNSVSLPSCRFQSGH